MSFLGSNFGLKDAEQLRKELINVERSLKLMSYDFPKIDDGDVNFLRKFVLLFKVINRIIEKSFRSSDFTFSWEEILSTLLHLDNDPNLMIKSMIRELKRRNSYNASLLNKRENKMEHLINLDKLEKFKKFKYLNKIGDLWESII